eukprot:scaffold78367_cov63-Attheya_sp.AAC.1
MLDINILGLSTQQEATEEADAKDIPPLSQTNAWLIWRSSIERRRCTHCKGLHICCHFQQALGDRKWVLFDLKSLGEGQHPQGFA